MARPGGAPGVAVWALRVLACVGHDAGVAAADGFGADLVLDCWGWRFATFAEEDQEEVEQGGEDDGSGAGADPDADFGAGGEAGVGRRIGG